MEPIRVAPRRRARPSWSLLTALALVASLSLAPAGAPKTLRLWPDDVVARCSAQWAFRSPGILWALTPLGYPGVDFSNVNFHAVLDLRVGREIQGVRYHHVGTGPDAYTAVSLLRVKLGQQPETLFSNSSTEDTSTPTVANIVPVDLIATSTELEVEKDYRYYVTVNIDNSHASVRGVEIVYR